MKKRCDAFTILLCCFLAMTLCAHADAPVNLSDISAGASYYFKNTTKLRAEVKNSYFIQQGSATDGEYGYFLALSNEKGDCTILKVDLSDYTIVSETPGVAVDHGNGMAYNPRTKQLIVSHCTDHPNRLSFIDKDTLTITGSVEMPMRVISVTYNESRDQYVVVHNHDRQFSILDSQFNILSTYDMVEDMFSNQDIDCDDQYIYLLQWQSSNGSNVNYIGVYDWDGNYVNRIKVRSLSEIESMFHIGDRVILAFYAGQVIVGEAQLYQAE